MNRNHAEQLVSIVVAPAQPVPIGLPPAKRALHAVLALVALTAVTGCEEYFDRAEADVAAPDGGSAADRFAGKGVGGACGTTADCREGLSCTGGACATTGSTPVDGKCLLDAECATGLHCSWAGFCTPKPGGKTPAGGLCTSSSSCVSGHFCKAQPPANCPAGAECGACAPASASDVPPEGEECAASSMCPPGLVCELIGLSGVCRRPTGQGDLGAACQRQVDCLAGLGCSQTLGQCVPGSLLLSPDVFSGVECYDKSEAEAPFQALVHVPRPGVARDFYAFPFPSDVYKKSGRLDLSAHPVPGAGAVGFDAAARVIEAMGEDMTGWGLSTAGYVRFTRPLDPTSVKTVATVAPAEANVRLVNLTTGQDVVIGAGDAVFKPERNKYICKNHLYVHARWSEILQPGTSYALLVTDGVRAAADAEGDKIPQPGADLPALLSGSAPADPVVKAAWDTYAPLRSWLTSNAGVKPVAATVFTTMDTRQQTRELYDTANQLPITLDFAPDGAPVVCKPGAISPCADPNWASTDKGKLGLPDPRACPSDAESKPFWEIHGKISLPVFQKGTRPYTNWASGAREGGLALQDGKPTLVANESVCVAITIPKASKPAGGWPLLVFAHGTGGSFRSAATGIAKDVAALSGGARWATLAIDQPMHAGRRGKDAAGKEIQTDPGPLFYNFANPPAARGNFYQGAADNYTLFRWAAGINKAIESISVDFDPAQLAYVGHSQGSTTGPMFLPYQKNLKGAVLSGCGGSLVYGLLGKKLPYDAATGLQIALQDIHLDEFHPILNLFQNYFEASDPLVYAPLIAAEGPTPMHVLQTYGHGDNYTPVTTSRIFAAAARLAVAQPASIPSWFDAFADLGVQPKALPLTNNLQTPAGPRTAVVVQALNDAANSLQNKAYDGHFVAFNDKTANRQVLEFLATLLTASQPTVVQ